MKFLSDLLIKAGLIVEGNATVNGFLNVGSGSNGVIKNPSSDGSLVYAGSTFNNASLPARTIIISSAGTYSGLTGGSNLFVGRNAGGTVTSGTSNVFIGKGAGAGVTTGGSNVILSSSDATNLPAAMANSLHLVAGNGYRSNDASSIPASAHAFIGGGFNTGFAIKDFYFGQMPFTADAGGGLVNIAFYAPSGLGTDIGGSSFSIAAGRGTGTGTPGDLIFRTSTAGASSSTVQTLTDRLRIAGGSGNLTVASLAGSGDRIVLANDSGVLSATLTNPVTGTGVAGQVAYWSGTNTQTGSNNLFWNNTTGRLDITAITTVANRRVGLNVASASASRIYVDSSAGGANWNSGFGINASGIEKWGIIGFGSTFDLSFFNSALTASAIFIKGNTNNVIIGSETDTGQRLQVTGDTLLKGSGNTSATTALTVQDSASTNLLRILNDGTLKIGSQNVDIFPTANGSTVGTAGRGLIISTSTGTQTTGAVKIVGASTLASGSDWSLWLSHSFAPASGTATHSGLLLNQTINQTGGANGITRGLYVNPTLTAAADWRSIEWSNNTGWGLYGAGVANNYLAGNLLIGSTNNFAKLYVSGNTSTATTQTFIGSQPVINQAVTNLQSYWSNIVGNLAVTITNAHSYIATQSAIASSTITNLFGFTADSSLTTATNIYGFYGNIAAATGRYNFYANGTALNYYNGNTIMGTLAADSGEKLQVNGTMKVTGASTLIGSGNTSATNALTVQNSDGTTMLRVSNSNFVVLQNIFPLAASTLNIYHRENFTSGILFGPNGPTTLTSGTRYTVVTNETFTPTSGNASFATQLFQPTINQTGGANGITRGLYINPTLTSAADFRAIEVSAGTTVLAPSVTARASLRIPSGTAPTSPVNGDIWFDGTDMYMRIGGVTKPYLITLTGEATNSGSTVTLTNSAVIGKVLTGLNVTSGAVVSTDSILTALGKVQGQINSLQGGTIYKGSWNANTNTPTITSGTGTSGNYYVVTTAGTTTIDGVSSWAVGDWIIFNGTVWEKIPNVDAVVSVNGQTGAVSLSTSNITEGSNLYYTDARARAAITLTTTGSSGASTYSSGVLNIPTYTLAGLGGVPTSRSLTINGTALDLSADRTFSVGTVTSIGLAVPTGFTASSAITTSGNITLGFTAGYSLPTTASQSNWDAAYNDRIVSASVSGTTTKTLTLTQQDAGTITASWTDDNSVTSVFGRTGAVVATSGDYTTAQVTESGNLYYTDTRARNAVSFTAGSGAYNSSTGVFTIPTNTNQLTNGAGFITGNQTITLSGDVTGSGATAITTTLATITQSTGSSFVKITLDSKGRVTGNTAVASGDITTALGYTPYNSSNPSGYTSNTGTVTSITAGTYLTGGTITSSGTIAVDATTTNTASKIVARDGSGNFAAGTITAALSGNATTSTTWQTARTITIGSTGKSVDGSGNVSWTLGEIGAQAVLTNPVTGNGSGATGYFPKFSGVNSIQNSNFFESGSGLYYGGGSAPEYFIKIGSGRSGNGFAYIDLIGDTTYTGYGMRLIRNDSGANSNSVIEHRGTGNLLLKTVDNGHIYFQTGSTDRIFIDSNNGALSIANSSAAFSSNTGEQLIVNGSAKFSSSVTATSFNAATQNIFSVGGTEGMRLTSTNRNLHIGTFTSDSGEKLQVAGDAKITGKLLLSGSVVTAVNGDYSVNFSKTYAQASAISNTNLYGLVSNAVFDLTNGAYSGSATYNATALFAQASVAGNTGTQSTQPIRSIMAVLVGKASSAAMNLADFRFIDVKTPDSGGVSGHLIGDVYGLRIASLKGASNYTITNGWGVYQEGTTDNNYFGGKVLVGTATAGSSPMRISGLPTSATGLSAGDLWNDSGTIKIA